MRTTCSTRSRTTSWPRETCGARCSGSCSEGCAARAAVTFPGCGGSWSGCALGGRQELERSNLDGRARRPQPSDWTRSCDQERAGIERRTKEAEQRALDAPPGDGAGAARMAEQVMRRTARQRENRLDALPPNLRGPPQRPARLRVHGRRRARRLQRAHRRAAPADARRPTSRGSRRGSSGITPEDLDGVREMVRDLNALLEKHATGADTTDEFGAFMAKHGRYFPPG